MPSTDGKKLFVVGGFTGSESNAVFSFDLVKKEWNQVYQEGNKQITPFSVSRDCLVGDKLVLFGGEINPSDKGHQGAGNFTNKILVLDGTTGKIVYQKISEDNLPEARGWASAASWRNNKMIVFGGR